MKIFKYFLAQTFLVETYDQGKMLELVYPQGLDMIWTKDKLPNGHELWHLWERKKGVL
jgi:hypothetical protein